MSNARLALAALLASLWSGTAPAALFRCGNVFQDRPCDAGVPQQHLRPGSGAGAGSGGASAATRASPFAAACSRVGEQAQRIAWKREGGATLERQRAEIPGGPERQELVALAETVYARRGTADEIRTAVEAECVQRRAEAARAAEAVRTSAPAAAPVAGPAAGNPACGNLREQRHAIEARLRSGGRPETLEMLQRQRRDVDKNLAETGC